MWPIGPEQSESHVFRVLNDVTYGLRLYETDYCFQVRVALAVGARSHHQQLD